MQSSQDSSPAEGRLPDCDTVAEGLECDTARDTGAEAGRDVDNKADDVAEVADVADVADDGWDDVLGSGRLKKKVLEKGEGSRPERGSAVTVDVAFKLESEGEVISKEDGLVFNVGEMEVISCVDLSVALMLKGELALLQVSPDFAYADKGNLDKSIPPGAHLWVEVRLVDFTGPMAIHSIQLAERHQVGLRKRERGNWWYSREDYTMATHCYMKAAEYLDDEQIEADMDVPIDRFMLPKELQALLEDRVKTLNNMAQAQMKLSAWDAALSSVRQVLRIQPNNEKALFRKAKILQEKMQTEEAVGILRRVNRMYPDNKQCQVELNRLTSAQRRSREREQLMSRKMLGLDSRPSKSSWLSRPVSIGLAALGGLGAALGTYLAKQYNLF